MHRKPGRLARLARVVEPPVARLWKRHVAPYAWAAGGLVLLSASAWQLSTVAGLATAGISCWVMEIKARSVKVHR